MADTKTDREVVGNKVASIFLLKKETNLKSSDLIKTKYSDFIVYLQKYFKGSIIKYCEISEA